MSVEVIVSYDGTANDDDALALGKVLLRLGATIALTYVRHSCEFDPRREEIAQHDAERRLEQGAAWLEEPDVIRHIVMSPSTGEGVLDLARTESALLVVFGSDYRTAPGRAEPGASAWRLLEGGPVAIAIAAAGLRTEGDVAISTVGVWPPNIEGAAWETAEALGERLGARVIPSGNGAADLTVVDSRPDAPRGQLHLDGLTRSALNGMQGSVIVVPHATPLLL